MKNEIVTFVRHPVSGMPETNCRFNKPKKGSKYVGILITCLNYSNSKAIYPTVKDPVMKQVRDMCRAGLLQRYKADGRRGYFYRTTGKGFDLIGKVFMEG